MSFILDALRKSEHERQRQSGPALVEAAVAAPRPRANPWATAAIALLVVNLTALGVFLLMKSRSGDEPARTPAAESAPGAASAPAAATGTPPPIASTTPQASVTRTLPAQAPPVALPPMLRPAGPEPVPAGRNPLEREVSGDDSAMSDEAAAFAAAPPPGPPAVVATPAHRGSVVYQTTPDADPVTASPRASRTRDLPMADEMTAGTGLPELRLELHVYSSRPPERFVFINSRKYREGETTQEGASIEEITPDGVVMSAGGKRFLLPRD